MSFVHLQVISSYSLLQSTTRLEDLVKAARKKGYKALALTDHDVLYGQVDFYKYCRQYGLKPLIGMQLELEGVLLKEQKFPLVLLAKNQAGYQALMKLSTEKLTDGRDSELKRLLAEKAEDLIAITPGIKGELETLLLNKEYEQASQIVRAWKTVWEQDGFYIGIQLHPKLLHIKEELKRLAQETEVPVTAMWDVRYLEPQDFFSSKVLQAIDRNEQIDVKSEAFSGNNYLPAIEEVTRRFEEQDCREAVEQTQKIADQIELDLPLHQKLLPKYPVPGPANTQDFLKKQCETGLEQRVGPPNEAYRQRLQYELDVIHEMGFDDYFLIVWDVMAYAKKAGILPGAGRGSAAGSLVAFALQITHVDPLEYDLLFERFLNKERFTMPDIDLDFPDDRREEILQYVKRKYGGDRVAQIATFGTLAAKMSLRDTARVFGLSPQEASRWTNAVPNQLGITLELAQKMSPQLQRLIQTSKETQLLFQTAQKIEGVPRHVSTHAAGVVISDEPLTEVIPLQQKNSELFLTQYPMGNVEEIGLLKMDFLGLKNLSVLNETVDLVKKHFGRTLDILQLPMDDEETLSIFREADTNGIFQFESAGIRKVLRQLGPESIEDIAAVNALYRPGPMEQIEHFIARKKGRESIEYPHPDLESILKVTYGVMVYQEQVMQVASRMAGFTLGEADILRRAIGKKKKEALDEQRENFVQGALKQGYEKKVAETVYDYIERFANYGFNRSHSVAYSFIAYQLAYLKAHYPQAFYAALLNSVNQHSSKMKEYLLDVKKHQLEIEYPDINESQWDFSLREAAIQFGLGGIKGLRRDFVADILSERRERGNYSDFVSFLRRIPAKWLKTEHLFPLIYSGCFDRFGYSRATLLQSLPGMINSIEYSGNNVALFSVLEPKYLEVEELALLELIEKEEEVLGHSLKGHPVDQYDRLYREGAVSYLAELPVNRNGRTMGLIRKVKKIQTKKGEPMAFFTLTDSSGSLSVTVFPEQYIRHIPLIKEGQLIAVEGKMESSSRDNSPSFICSRLLELETFSRSQEKGSGVCYIKITAERQQEELFRRMQEILQQSPGDMPVVVYEEKYQRAIKLNAAYSITPNAVLMTELKKMFGTDNIVIK